MPAAWLLLLVAISVEVATTATLPRTNGFTALSWTALVIAGYATSIGLLSVAVKYIPVSIAYAAWAGLGTAGIAVVGYYFLDEPFDLLKVAALGLIIVGVLVLNLHSAR